MSPKLVFRELRDSFTCCLAISNILSFPYKQKGTEILYNSLFYLWDIKPLLLNRVTKPSRNLK